MKLLDLFNDEDKAFFSWYVRRPYHRDDIKMLDDGKLTFVCAGDASDLDYSQTSNFTDWVNEGIKKSYLSVSNDAPQVSSEYQNIVSGLVYIVREQLRTGVSLETLEKTLDPYNAIREIADWKNAQDVAAELSQLSDYDPDTDDHIVEKVREDRQILFTSYFEKGLDRIRTEHPHTVVSFDHNTALVNVVFDEYRFMLSTKATVDDDSITPRKYCTYCPEYNNVLSVNTDDFVPFDGNRALLHLIYAVVYRYWDWWVPSIKDMFFKLDRRSFNRAVDRRSGGINLLDELLQLEKFVDDISSSAVFTVLASDDDYITITSPFLMNRCGGINQYIEELQDDLDAENDKRRDRNERIKSYNRRYHIKTNPEDLQRLKVDRRLEHGAYSYLININAVKAKSATTFETLLFIDRTLKVRGNNSRKRKKKGVEHSKQDPHAVHYHKSYKGLLEECPGLRNAVETAKTKAVTQVFRRTFLGNIKKEDIRRDQSALETLVQCGQSHISGFKVKEFHADRDKIYITADNADEYTIGRYLRDYTALFDYYNDLTLVLDRPRISVDGIDGNLTIYHHGINDDYEYSDGHTVPPRLQVIE